MIIIVLLVCVFLGVGLFVSDLRGTSVPIENITRRGYGEGEVKRTLRVYVDGKKTPKNLDIQVKEKRYTEEERKKVLKRFAKELESAILGENNSLDRITKDMDLVTSLPGEPMNVSWELDRYDLMNIYGEIAIETLKEPTVVNLRAIITYREDETSQVIHEIPIKLYPEINQEMLRKVESEVEKKEEESRQKSKVVMPQKVDGKQIVFRDLKNYRGIYVLFLGIFIAVLLVMLERQEEKEKKKEREQQMMIDYPEIIDKLSLLLGSGMNVKRAWQKIVEDYYQQKAVLGERFAYEEMATSIREMEGGVTELESYDSFGKRCGIKVYRKLASILTQNLKKGTRGLTELMNMEAMTAFEERKAIAKRKGEEAGTKLLVPMFLMLAMVLIIVILPAFLSIQA